MKIFCFSNKSSYGGGCAIVAANSAYEAYGVLCSYSEFSGSITSVDKCVEVKHLQTDLKEPGVIINKFYTE